MGDLSGQISGKDKFATCTRKGTDKCPQIGNEVFNKCIDAETASVTSTAIFPTPDELEEVAGLCGWCDEYQG